MSAARALARHAVFPGTAAVALFVAHEMLARGTAPEAVIVIWFGLMPWVIVLERWLPRHVEWNRSHNDIRADLIYFPTSMIVAGGLSALWGGFHLWLAIGLQEAVGSPVWPLDWPLVVQVAVACVLAEFFAYWPHR